ncbi:hypothetical protein [Amycolatopsis ultiminotia]|uniref:hypothetical protein n=1 Tax=Amycolatopsis ultiminotia TaxID=543629 RepID=UPI0031EED867
MAPTMAGAPLKELPSRVQQPAAAPDVADRRTDQAGHTGMTLGSGRVPRPQRAPFAPVAYFVITRSPHPVVGEAFRADDTLGRSAEDRLSRQ